MKSEELKRIKKIINEWYEEDVTINIKEELQQLMRRLDNEYKTT